MTDENKTTRMLGVKDLQKRLNIGRDTAYSLMRSKAFPSMKLGGRYRVSEALLEKWEETYCYGRDFDLH